MEGLTQLKNITGSLFCEGDTFLYWSLVFSTYSLLLFVERFYELL